MELSASTYLGLIVAVYLAGFLLGELLEWLNLRHSGQPLPEAGRDIYDAEEYARSQAYQRQRTRLGFVSSAFNALLTLVMLWLGGFGWLDAWLSGYISHPVLLPLAYFGVLLLASDWLNLPFQLYSTFVIEEKYGFNRTTLKTFVTDKLKGYLLAALIGGAVLGGLFWLILRLGPSFWWYFWIAITAFMLLMNMFYTTLILPLFNKLTPLPEGGLRQAIEDYSRQVGFPLANIYVMDGSRRSSKANAFFSGLGRKKKVVLYDTLIEKHSVEEVVAVFAHEVGHYKKRHIWQGLVLSALQTGFMLWLLSFMVFDEQLSRALGAEALRPHLNLIAFGILYSPVSLLIGVAGLWLSRKNEYEADRYAVHTSDGRALMQALKKLASGNLSNLLPHPAYVFMHYSHPPLLQRLAAIRQAVDS